MPSARPWVTGKRVEEDKHALGLLRQENGAVQPNERSRVAGAALFDRMHVANFGGASLLFISFVLLLSYSLPPLAFSASTLNSADTVQQLVAIFDPDGVVLIPISLQFTNDHLDGEPVTWQSSTAAKVPELGAVAELVCMNQTDYIFYISQPLTITSDVTRLWFHWLPGDRCSIVANENRVSYKAMQVPGNPTLLTLNPLFVRKEDSRPRVAATFGERKPDEMFEIGTDGVPLPFDEDSPFFRVDPKSLTGLP